MRLDLFLKVSRLIPRRTLAQAFCDANKVKVNDAAAKSSKEVKAGDEITIRRGDRTTRVSVLQIPDKKQVSKESAETLYKITAEQSIEEPSPLA